MRILWKISSAPPDHARSPMSAGVSLLLVIVVLCRGSLQMWCLDGSDCEQSDTCSICEGAACLRVQRNHPMKGATVAMTCLPHDSLIHSYHPEGCRNELASGEKLCLCSAHDFCNTTTPRRTHFSVLLVLVPHLFLLRLLVF
uniref:Activin types I and II receptor domain-containing protein n=2 Tax=Caenorhabditis japonica TaxID=281687 RepID=A0A8R1ICH4_CAEJA